MIDEIKKDLENTMSKALDSLIRNIAKIRAGRPNPSLLDDIEADYFDTKTPIKQLANISVSDASTLTLNVWDKSAIVPIEKAIMESNLGLSPAVSGTNIHIKIPPLTEERRNDLIKLLKKESENTKVALRNIRRNTNTLISNLEKDIYKAELDKIDKKDDIKRNILEGKIKKFIAENTLINQPYIKDSSLTLKKILKNNKIIGYARYQLGEGIDKKSDNFAEEVYSQIK